MSLFLHYITTDRATIRPGETLETHWEVSHYWQQKLTGDWVEATRPSLPAGLQQMQNLLPQLVPMFEQMLGNIASHAKYSGEVLKEYIFEEVRAARFPTLPSRRNCMFLFERHFSPKEYARAFKLPERGTFVEIDTDRASGRTFRSDSRLLDCGFLHYPDLASRAAEYWSGTDKESPYNEILFRGRYRIVQPVDW